MSHVIAPKSTERTHTVINIGEVLRRAGAVTQEQIDDAVAVAFETHTMLGEALLAIGACSKADLELALDRQARIAGGAAGAVKALDELLQDTFKASRKATVDALASCYLVGP